MTEQGRGAEQQRIAALRRLAILDSSPEERFDRITRTAAAVLDVPIALLSLVDADRQWFKSRVGLAVSETPRDVAFCAHAIADLDHDEMVVDDALADDRFATNPLVEGDPNIRFYAGHVVRSPDGERLGTLCVIDRVPRQLSGAQRQVLADLAAMAEEELGRFHSDELRDRLDEAHQTKSAVLAALSEGLVVQGPGGEFVEWNAAAERLLGLRGDEVTHRALADSGWGTVTTDGADWPVASHPAMVSLASGRAVGPVEMGVDRPDGTRVWLEVTSRPMVGSSSEPRVLTVFADVTHRRDLESDLRSSEEIARRSLDALDQGVILAGPDGSIRRSNPAAERILGFTAAQLTERFTSGNWVSYDVDRSVLPVERRPLRRAFAGETVIDQTMGWERRDGEFILIKISCHPGVHGPDSVLATFTDVTSEHQMFQELARFQYLFEHASDMVTVIDQSGRVLYSSPSVERVLGFDPKAQMPMKVLEMVHPDDVERARAELAALSAGTRGPEPFMARIHDSSGEWHHIETVGANLLGEPAVRGLVLTSRDATERVLLTEQLSHIARHDPLTGLPNRSVLDPALREALLRAEDDGGPVGLCFIDLDGFKSVNDHHGHAVGDEVLVEVARRIAATTRVGDTAVRVGGDEFVVIVGGVEDARDTRDVAARIRDAIIDPPITRGAQAIGASFGVAVSHPSETPASLLLRADNALYLAKRSRTSAIEVAAAPHPTIW